MAGTLVITTLSDGTNSTSATNCIQGSARVWLTYNLNNQTTLASYGLSSVTYNSTGVFTMNFTTAFSDANYCVVCGSTSYNPNDLNRFVMTQGTSGAPTSKTTTAVRMTGGYGGSPGNDVQPQSVAIFR
jgi:hypothetical protein